MSPLERAVVERQLQHLRELVLLLRQESGRSLESFLADRREPLLVERLLHLADLDALIGQLATGMAI